MSAVTECRFSTNGLRRCTGRSTKLARVTGKFITNVTNECRSRSRLAAIPRYHFPRPRRCRMVSMRICLPVFKINFPELVDMTLPAEGVFHNLVFVSIRKQYPYQAFKVMHGLWGMGQMMFSKYIVVLDEDCDVHNTSEVLFRLCANTDPARDTTVIRNPSDSLDHAPTEQNVGSHMGFDATRKLPGENYHRQWPELLKMTDEAKALVDGLQKKTR